MINAAWHCCSFKCAQKLKFWHEQRKSQQTEQEIIELSEELYQAWKARDRQHFNLTAQKLRDRGCTVQPRDDNQPGFTIKWPEIVLRLRNYSEPKELNQEYERLIQRDD